MNDNYEKLLYENIKLKEENAYLKKILKVNNIRYKEYSPITKKDFTKSEKIEIYSSYFKERTDILPKNILKNQGVIEHAI